MASVCIQRISGLFDKMSSKQRGESYEELQLVSRRRLASQLWRGKYPVTADQSLYNTTTLELEMSGYVMIMIMFV